MTASMTGLLELVWAAMRWTVLITILASCVASGVVLLCAIAAWVFRPRSEDAVAAARARREAVTTRGGGVIRRAHLQLVGAERRSVDRPPRSAA